MEKRLLRKKYLQIRNDVINKEQKSDVIFQKIISCKEYKEANVIGIYVSLKNEVNTLKIIEHALKQGKTVYIPKVEEGYLEFYKYTLGDSLEKNKFGIFEPKADIVTSKDKIDLFIVPGVCFDLKNNRIGFGKGYYDKFLKDITGYKLGICFEEQISKEDIPVSDFDIPMDKVITG